MDGEYDHCLNPCRDIYAQYGRHEPNCRGDEVAALVGALARLLWAAEHTWLGDADDDMLPAMDAARQLLGENAR